MHSDTIGDFITDKDLSGQDGHQEEFLVNGQQMEFMEDGS